MVWSSFEKNIRSFVRSFVRSFISFSWHSGSIVYEKRHSILSARERLQLIHVTRERKPEHVIRVFKWTSYFQWHNGDHKGNIEDLIESCKNWILSLEKQGVVMGQIFVLSRDRVISGFASRQWFKNVEVGEIMSIILLMRDCCFNQTGTNLGVERLCKNGNSEWSGRKPRYMCRVK